MNIRPVIAMSLLALVAGTAAAQTPPSDPSSPPAPSTAPATAPRDAERAPEGVDRFCLRETGSLIRARRASTSRDRCPTHQFGRVYTQDDLRTTGQVDIAQALRMLDPSIR